MNPQRIQRKRTKGWKAPEGAVYVGRGSNYGNRFAIGTEWHQNADGWIWPTWLGRSKPANIVVKDSAHAAELFRSDPHIQLKAQQGFFEKLRGKTLMCWCKEGEPCHADVLLELANREVKA